MNDTERMQLLSEILNSGQSELSWKAICELIFVWPENKEKDLAIDFANKHLSSWNDESRHVYSSSIFSKGQIYSLAKIVRSVIIYKREENGNRELIAICESPFIKDLKYLVVNKSDIYIEGIRSLTTTRFLNNLISVSFESSTLTEDELTFLFSASNLTALSALRFKNAGLTAPRINLLLNSSLIRSVTSLNLSYNNLNDESALIIANCNHLGNLKILDLSNNFIRDTGAKALANSNYLNSLEQIIIIKNALTAAGMEYLTQISLNKKINILFK